MNKNNHSNKISAWDVFMFFFLLLLVGMNCKNLVEAKFSLQIAVSITFVLVVAVIFLSFLSYWTKRHKNSGLRGRELDLGLLFLWFSLYGRLRYAPGINGIGGGEPYWKYLLMSVGAWTVFALLLEVLDRIGKRRRKE